MHTAALAVKASLELVKAPRIYAGRISHTCAQTTNAAPNLVSGKCGLLNQTCSLTV